MNKKKEFHRFHSFIYTITSRSDSTAGFYPTICRQASIHGDDSDDDRASVEYYSGEEFQEDDLMLAGDRYLHDMLLYYCSHPHSDHNSFIGMVIPSRAGQYGKNLM